MSFIDDVLDVGSDVWDWATGNSTSAGVARAAALGYMLKEVQASINKSNDANSSESRPYGANGVREAVDPDTENTVPVVYGRAVVRPRVVDAVLTADKKTMWYALVLAEQTGPLLSTNLQTPSQIIIQEIYWNTLRMNFSGDGVTLQSLTSTDGAVSATLGGKIKVYAYSGGSESPVRIGGGAVSDPTPAYEVMPGWTTEHQMNDLVFLIVRVDYDAENKLTGLGDIEVKLRNTMRMPGDVLYDYMTNTRYGAGIPPEEIKS